MNTPSPRYGSVSGYLGEVATCGFTASQMNKPYSEISLESASRHSKRAGTVSMGGIRFRRLHSINRSMTGYWATHLRGCGSGRRTCISFDSEAHRFVQSGFVRQATYGAVSPDHSVDLRGGNAPITVRNCAFIRSNLMRPMLARNRDRPLKQVKQTC